MYSLFFVVNDDQRIRTRCNGIPPGRMSKFIIRAMSLKPKCIQPCIVWQKVIEPSLSDNNRDILRIYTEVSVNNGEEYCICRKGRASHPIFMAPLSIVLLPLQRNFNVYLIRRDFSSNGSLISTVLQRLAIFGIETPMRC
jgi:hypothetical protein